MAQLKSIQVGLPLTYSDPETTAASGKPWRTGFFKLPVTGPVQVWRTNLEGDGQADLKNHGGVDKAILAYSADSYPFWRDLLQVHEISEGGFGENLTIAGLAEGDVCIGDQWEIQNVILQVSQPRQPCWKLGRRWGIPELPKLVVQNGRSGWYFRVLQEGTLLAGQELKLIARPHPEWTIALANQAMFDKQFPIQLAENLTLLAELSDAWREDLQRRLSARQN